MDRHYEWRPRDFLCTEGKTFAFMILNGELNIEEELLTHLWTKAALRLTVDGGTNLWVSFIDGKLSRANISPLMPELVTGDLDSITPETLERCKGVSHVERTPDQDETDFTKALKFMTSYLDRKSIKVDFIVVTSETSGRIDQILSNMNTLFTCEAERTTKDVPIVLLSSNSLTWLLADGQHSIFVPEAPEMKTLFRNPGHDWLALLPLGHPSTVTTTGLKWNLSETVLKFGGLVSSSNTYGEEPIITVRTDHPVIFAMGLDARQN